MVITLIPEETVASGTQARWSIPGFEMVVAPPVARLVLSVWGGEKVGKTSLALSFPPPVLFMNFDYSLDELLYKRPEMIGLVGKRNFPISETMIARELEPVLLEFEAAYAQGILAAADAGGTVVIDTATQLWQIVQDVKVNQVREERVRVAERKNYDTQKKKDEAIERAGKPMQLDYGQANMYMAALVRKTLHHPALNACFINRAKPEYNDSGKTTGAMEYHGFGEMPGITQAHVQLYKKPVGGISQHFARITRCRFDSSLEGLDIVNPTYEIIRDMMLG